MHVDWKMFWSVMAALGCVDGPEGMEYHQKTAALRHRNWVIEDETGRLVLNSEESDAMVKDAFLNGRIAERKELIAYLANKAS